MDINTKEYFRKLADRLRRVIPFYGFAKSAIQLIFMKYMTEFNNANSNEDFKVLMDYQRMFISKEFNPEVIVKTYEIAERTYGIQKGLFRLCVDDMVKIFSESSDYVFAVLSEISLPKSSDDMASFIEIMLDYTENKDVSRTAVNSANQSLINLVDEILGVKKDETYLDCFSGFYRTGLRLNANEYIGYEINPEICSIANMIMILCSKRNFKLINQDFYMTDCKGSANKVFADGPLTGTLTPDQFYYLGESKKTEFHTLKKAVQALLPGGTSAVTCPAGVLYRYDLKELRKSLTFRNIKAVISLPPLWRFTSINTNIIVCDYERTTDKIMMIDASSLGLKIDKRTSELSRENIDLIVKAVNGLEIDEISTAVTVDDIMENEIISWYPAKYVKKRIEALHRNIEEINKDLDEAYAEFSDLIK